VAGGRGRGSLGRALCVLGLVTAGLVACGGDEGGTPTLSWYTFPEPSGAFDKAAADCTEAAGGRYRIEVKQLPTTADGQREQLVRRLAAEDSDVDLMFMDVIWTAEFAEAGWLLPFDEQVADDITKGVLEGPLATATYKDRLWGAPITSNTQLLWYRKDRVDDPPETWDQLIQAAEALPEGQQLVQAQGSRYEGLTVWFNALLASAGGTVIEGEGDDTEVTIGNDATRQALQVLRDFSRSAAADPALSNSDENIGRLAFQTGGSSFMVNYPFIFPSAREEAPDVFENLGWARYPGMEEGTPSKPPLGGGNIGIGAFTDHPDEAVDATRCLISADNQIRYATDGGLPPTLDRLYDDEALRESYPFADLLRDSIDDAGPRPVTPAYNDISRVIYTTIHPTRSIDPEGDASTLEDKVGQAVRSEGLL
jgi:multiple sugar transport system substrate-binding protein